MGHVCETSRPKYPDRFAYKEGNILDCKQFEQGPDITANSKVCSNTYFQCLQSYLSRIETQIAVHFDIQRYYGKLQSFENKNRTQH